MTEEERAALHREQVRNRAQYRCVLFTGLHGDLQKREELDANWAPPVLAHWEAQYPGTDADFLEEMYCRVPAPFAHVTDFTTAELLP